MALLRRLASPKLGYVAGSTRSAKKPCISATSRVRVGTLTGSSNPASYVSPTHPDEAENKFVLTSHQHTFNCARHLPTSKILCFPRSQRSRAGPWQNSLSLQLGSTWLQARSIRPKSGNIIVQESHNFTRRRIGPSRK